MIENIKNFFNDFSAMLATPEGQIMVTVLGIWLGVVLLIMCFYGIYAIRVFKRQIAEEPRVIPVLATLYHIVGFFVGILYLGFVIGLFASILPDLILGNTPDMPAFFEQLYMLSQSDLETIGLVISVIYVIFFVWSWITIFDSFYTVFNPSEVREKYSSDIGDVLVRHRRWIVIPPLVLFGLYFIFLIAVFVIAFVLVIV